MDNRTLDLGVVTDLHAESFGEPGSRTFRLSIRLEDGLVSLWLEKEQVVMLGSAIDEVLRRVPGELGDAPTAEPQRPFRGELEVKVGSLAVGFDATHEGFSVEASEFESPFNLSDISLLANRETFSSLSREIEEIVSAGRPRCPLCGRPITDGHHFCPESNGHANLSRS